MCESARQLPQKEGVVKGWWNIEFQNHVNASTVAQKHMLGNGSQAPRLGATTAEMWSRFLGSVLNAGDALNP